MALPWASQFVVQHILGIDTNKRFSQQPPCLEERARSVLHPAEIYWEDEPTVTEIIKDLAPSLNGILDYFSSLFPFARWMRRYNMTWFWGDVTAGITVGLVIVPQAMAYALLAELPPSYGLYTSFTGAMLYWLFGTSKDIVIGATAVGSLLVGQVVTRVDSQAPGKYSHEESAQALSLISGAILVLLGLLRLGWVVEFIPYIPISAFISGASITIMSTQLPTLLGITDIKTRDAPFWVILNTFRGLSGIQLDAVIGLSSMSLLFFIRWFCGVMESRQHKHRRVWAALSSLRASFIMLLFTLISFLVNRKLDPEQARFRIVGPIDRGFQHLGVPKPDPELLGLVLPELPAVTIILVIEHIAIAKSMGRLYNYTVNPSQEIVALGAANMLSPFVGGYVCTGSFGASAVLSKSGVRTPLAGLFSALVLVLTLYALTGAFYYIPNAALSGLIIHAVYNLIAEPHTLFRYWQLSPFELLIWVAGLALALFVSLEWAIYVGVILTLLLMMGRLARTRGSFLGRVRYHHIEGDEEGSPKFKDSPSTEPTTASHKLLPKMSSFVALSSKTASNSSVAIEVPYPGVFIYRFNEAYNYTNQAHHADTIREYVTNNTKQMEEEHYERESDRLWNDNLVAKCKAGSDDLPYLRAIVLDFAAVNNLDITSINGLADLRNAMERYAAPDAVEWHFANINNRWTRKALAVAGFGYPTSRNQDALRHWRPVYSIAAASPFTALDHNTTRPKSEVQVIDDKQPASVISLQKVQENGSPRTDNSSVISTMTNDTVGGEPQSRGVALTGVDRPFFHMNLYEAVEAAVRDAESKDGVLRAVGVRSLDTRTRIP